MATNAQLAQFQSFPDVRAMDQRIDEFITKFKYTMSASKRKVLDFIKTHAVHVPGVCNAGVRKIAKEIGVTDRTVQRAIVWLEKSGLIEVKEVYRENGSQAANAYIVQPAMSSAVSPDPVTPLHEKSLTPLSTPENSRIKDESAARTSTEINELDLVPEYVPSTFVQVVGSIFPRALDVIDKWHVVRSAQRVLGRKIPLTTALQAFTHAYYKQRHGGGTRNFNGYLKRTLLGMMRGSDGGKDSGESEWRAASDDRNVNSTRTPSESASPAAHDKHSPASGGLYTPDDEDALRSAQWAKLGALTARSGRGAGDPNDEQSNKYDSVYAALGMGRT